MTTSLCLLVLVCGGLPHIDASRRDDYTVEKKELDISVAASAVDLSILRGSAKDVQQGGEREEWPWSPTENHELWNSRLIDNMLNTDMTDKEGDERVLVDDHDSTPIGEGDSLAVVGGMVRMDSSKLPAKYQVGLFKPSLQSLSWPAVVRFSHAHAADTDLTRIAFKFDTGADAFGVVDLLTTETLKAFPMHDNTSLEAFTYMQQYGTGWALAKHTSALLAMKKQADYMRDKYATIGKERGAVSKEYYSQLPYAIADTAMKFRLRPQIQALSDSSPGNRIAPVTYPTDAGKSQYAYQKAMRKQLAETVGASDWVFDFQIQTAEDPVRQPINDGAVEWDEASSPYVTVGQLIIPQQTIPVSSESTEAQRALNVANCVGSALLEDGAGSKGVPFGSQKFSSKEFLFDPSATPHKPVGDINEFRAQLYAKYDGARQEYLLAKPGGVPAEAPFENIRRFMNSD